MGNLDNRVANADQLLTQDVEKFCNSVVDLYSNVSKVLPYMLLISQTSQCTDTAALPHHAGVIRPQWDVNTLYTSEYHHPVGRVDGEQGDPAESD